MADYIDIDELKDVLGVGDFYPDATLQTVIDTTNALIDSFLTYKAAGLTAAQFDHPTSTATYWTQQRVNFSVGEDINITTYYGAPFEGTQTVTAVGEYTFTTSKSHSGSHDRTELVPRGRAIDNGQIGMYDTDPQVRMAALQIAVDLWAARQAPNGSAQGVDFVPGPYKAGKSMLSRVIGLLGNRRDVEGMVG